MPGFPFQASESVRRAVGDLGTPELPRITFEGAVRAGAAQSAGLLSESRQYAPRIRYGETVQTEKGSRFTVVRTVSDPFIGIVEVETQAIDLGTGVLMPIVADAPLPPAEMITPPPPPPPPAETPLPEPTYTPTSEVTAPPPTPSATEGTGFTALQEAQIEEMVAASGCQPAIETDYAPDGTVIGFHILHSNGGGYDKVGYEALY